MENLNCLIKNRWGMWIREDNSDNEPKILTDYNGKLSDSEIVRKNSTWKFHQDKKTNAVYPSDTLLVFTSHETPNDECLTAPLYGETKYHILVSIPDAQHFPLDNSAPGIGLFNQFIKNEQVITWFQRIFGRFIVSSFLNEVKPGPTRFLTTPVLWLWKHVQLCGIEYPFNVKIENHPSCCRDTLEAITTGDIYKDHYVDPKNIAAAISANKTWIKKNMTYMSYLKEMSKFRQHFDSLPGNGHLSFIFDILLKYKYWEEHCR